METDHAIRALAALAQPTRLDIFRLLVRRGPEGLAPGAIAQKLGLPNATLSFHLKELAGAQLIAPRQEGRFIFYAANYPKMNDLVGFLTDNCCGGADCGVAAATVRLPKPKRSIA